MCVNVNDNVSVCSSNENSCVCVYVYDSHFMDFVSVCVTLYVC